VSTYPEKLPIVPFTRPVRGSVTLPGSKSITNRALILAALSPRITTLHGALFSRDTRIMVAALRQLGFKVETDESALTITVEGRNGEIPVREAKIDVGNAGTAARFLTAFVCLRPDGVYHFDGDEAMRRRPIGALLETLEAQGARTSSSSFPFTLQTAGLPGGEMELDASESSQLLSALLMIAPFSKTPTVIQLSNRDVSKPFVVMTLKMMQRFQGGISTVVIDEQKNTFSIRRGSYVLPEGVTDFNIEADATAASYFVALPILNGGTIRISDYHTVLPLQGDIEFARLLQREGLIDGFKEGRPTHYISPGPRKNGVIASFRGFSDTFLTLAAIAPLLDGPTKISGIAHTRKQETDRVAGMARELTKLGQHVVETEDSLEIHPRPLTAGVEIETYHDHRFAMSFGILGCHDLLKNGQPWLTIKDPACCAKTFPAFFDLLAGLRAGSH